MPFIVNVFLYMLRTCVMYVMSATAMWMIAQYLPLYEKIYRMSCAPSQDRSDCASAQSDQSLLDALWIATDLYLP